MIDLLRAGTGAALFTLALAAQAQSFHAGLAGGATKSNSGCIGASSCDKTDVGGRAWVGVTNKDGLGLEVVAQDFGAVRATAINPGTGITTTLKATLQGVGIGPIWDYREGNFSAHARAGVGSYWTELDANTGGIPTTLKDRHNEFYFSLGLGWRFADRFTAIGAIDWSQATNREGGYNYNAVLYTLGVQVGF